MFLVRSAGYCIDKPVRELSGKSFCCLCCRLVLRGGYLKLTQVFRREVRQSVAALRDLVQQWKTQSNSRQSRNFLEKEIRQSLQSLDLDLNDLQEVIDIAQVKHRTPTYFFHRRLTVWSGK